MITKNKCCTHQNILGVLLYEIEQTYIIVIVTFITGVDI